MNNKWILVAGLILGLISGLLVYQRLNQDEEILPIASQSYLRLLPSVSISKGDVINWVDLEEISVPANFEPLSSVAVRSTSEVETWLSSGVVRATHDIEAGSFLLTESLIDRPQNRFSASISEKGRAISIPVSEMSAVAYFIEPGSRVDVLVTVPRYQEPSTTIQPVAFGSEPNFNADDILASTLSGPQTLVTRTLLQNMLVLAVGNSTTRNAYVSQGMVGYATITLDATLEEAELLTFASTQARGGMNLVLRNPLNTEVEGVDSVDWKGISD